MHVDQQQAKCREYLGRNAMRALNMKLTQNLKHPHCTQSYGLQADVPIMCHGIRADVPIMCHAIVSFLLMAALVWIHGVV